MIVYYPEGFMRFEATMPYVQTVLELAFRVFRLLYNMRCQSIDTISLKATPPNLGT